MSTVLAPPTHLQPKSLHCAGWRHSKDQDCPDRRSAATLLLLCSFNLFCFLLLIFLLFFRLARGGCGGLRSVLCRRYLCCSLFQFLADALGFHHALSGLRDRDPLFQLGFSNR